MNRHTRQRRTSNRLAVNVLPAGGEDTDVRVGELGEGREPEVEAVVRAGAALFDDLVVFSAGLNEGKGVSAQRTWTLTVLPW